ncbi:MAG: pilus assembly protein [Thermoanaerobacteraceae bacterium]|nr:pilus assembly protein [Thermoanaerobacteraceae bacterium]
MLVKLRETKGQALVEIALVLPLVLILILGTLELGHVIHASLVINHAAREGARLGALNANDSEIINRVNEVVTLPGSSQPQIFITPTEGNRKPGESITVEVRYPVTIYAPLVNYFLPNPFVVKSQVTMRVE